MNVFFSASTLMLVSQINDNLSEGKRGPRDGDSAILYVYGWLCVHTGSLHMTTAERALR